MAVALHLGTDVIGRLCGLSRALVTLLAGLALLGAAGPEGARPAEAPAETAAVTTADDVMASLQRTLAWYQGARVAIQSVRGVLDSDLERGEEQTAQRIVLRAFDVARGRAKILGESGSTDSAATSRQRARADRQAQIRAGIERDEQEIARLKTRIRTAPPATRPGLERELVAAGYRLELGRIQLDFVAKLVQVDASTPGAGADLTDDIQALQDSVPEMAPTAGPSTVVTSSARETLPSGARMLVYRLLALYRSRSALQELGRRTADLIHDVNAEIRTTQQAVRPLVARLRQLAKDPAADGIALTAGQQEFRELLARAKLTGAVVLPLREESVLLQRYAADVQAWTRALDREIGHVLRGFGIELVGVGIALGGILVGSVVWRIAAVRYVKSPYHRRFLLTARHVVVVTAVALVLVLHFASELTALVAALGFAAAGIAFALQNVILAVAGYFSMVAPNGIRVGDRVSLQGPFGYVHGEVIEIGVVRTRLRELAGDPLHPTGRVLVFPNSVAFTGSFIKHPPPDDA